VNNNRRTFLKASAAAGAFTLAGFPHIWSKNDKCPSCGSDMRGTEEKGVDVRIATDMVMLAWVDSYDIAVLVSSDSDFVPVAQFLQTKGKKVVHAAFPPRGALLSQKCWGSIDVPSIREEFRLPQPPAKSANVTPLAREARPAS